MVTDFEKLTAPLDKEEKKIAMVIGRYIYKFSRKGKESSNNFLRLYLHQNKYPQIKGVRVRAMIHWLRVNHKFKWILANGQGYYYSRNKQDLERYKTSLANRINSITKVRNSFK